MNIEFDPETGSGDGIYGLPHRPEDARTVLIPVPWDATTSYRPGTARGPEAILAASQQLDLEDAETGRPYEPGIAMLPIPEDLDAWNTEARAAAEPVIAALGPGDDPVLGAAADRVNTFSGQVNAWVHAVAASWLDRGRLVGVVGGDHASPYGLIQAVAERHPHFGILHVDAHADLREAYEGFTWSHASIMHNVTERLPQVGRLVQVGVRDYSRREHERIEADPERYHLFTDPELRHRLHDGDPWNRLVDRILAPLPDVVYVSFDIDGLDPTLCPNTGTPVPGGLSFPEATALLRRLSETGRRIVGFDLCEVAPDPTGSSEWDGNVGMRMLYKLIGFALKSQT